MSIKDLLHTLQVMLLRLARNPDVFLRRGLVERHLEVTIPFYLQTEAGFKPAFSYNIETSKLS
jgi:hypothetical protein